MSPYKVYSRNIYFGTICINPDSIVFHLAKKNNKKNLAWQNYYHSQLTDKTHSVDEWKSPLLNSCFEISLVQF